MSYLFCINFQYLVSSKSGVARPWRSSIRTWNWRADRKVVNEPKFTSRSTLGPITPSLCFNFSRISWRPASFPNRIGSGSSERLEWWEVLSLITDSCIEATWELDGDWEAGVTGAVPKFESEFWNNNNNNNNNNNRITKLGKH